MGAIAELKGEMIARLLDTVDCVLVVVKPGVPGVKLPPDLMRPEEPVPLHIGRQLQIPIPDLVIDDKGISGTLQFGEVYFHCACPWASIVQVSLEGEHLVWVTPSEPEKQAPPNKARPQLRVV